jgi:hypothetical protein
VKSVDDRFYTIAKVPEGCKENTWVYFTTVDKNKAEFSSLVDDADSDIYYGIEWFSDSRLRELVVLEEYNNLQSAIINCQATLSATRARCILWRNGV